MTSTRRLGLKPVEDWLEDVSARGGRRLSAGEGAKGPGFPTGRRTCPTARSLDTEGWKTGLLIRRSIREPDKLAFHLTLSPAATGLAERVRVAGTRWAIEACFPPRAGRWPAGDPGCEAAKGAVGLDRYEVRSRAPLSTDRLASARHAGHAGARLACRGPHHRRRGER